MSLAGRAWRAVWRLRRRKPIPRDEGLAAARLERQLRDEIERKTTAASALNALVRRIALDKRVEFVAILEDRGDDGVVVTNSRGLSAESRRLVVDESLRGATARGPIKSEGRALRRTALVGSLAPGDRRRVPDAVYLFSLGVEPMPRWLLTTALLPLDETESGRVRKLAELLRAAMERGGHSSPSPTSTTDPIAAVPDDLPRVAPHPVATPVTRIQDVLDRIRQAARVDRVSFRLLGPDRSVSGAAPLVSTGRHPRGVEETYRRHELRICRHAATNRSDGTLRGDLLRSIGVQSLLEESRCVAVATNGQTIGYLCAASGRRFADARTLERLVDAGAEQIAETIGAMLSTALGTAQCLAGDGPRATTVLNRLSAERADDVRPEPFPVDVAAVLLGDAPGVVRRRDGAGPRETAAGLFASQTVAPSGRCETAASGPIEPREPTAVEQRELLASVTHELRSPMTGILGMTERVLETDLTDDQRTCLAAVRSSSESLLQLVNDLLDLSKLDAGGMEIESVEFPLRRTARETLLPLELQAQHKGIELRFETDESLPELWYGDPLRFRQILTNLASNAIKFTERGSVTVEMLATPPGGLSVSVRDTGPGIPAETRDRLFQRYAQADASIARRYGGTGLGLAICRQLVEKMGGTIGVDSDVGRGSTFWFTLPFTAAAEQPAAPARSQAAPPPRRKTRRMPHEARERSAAASIDIQPLRILLADDDEINRRLGQLRLSQAGHHVDLACDGQDAVARHTASQYDVVLMDVQMPRLNGLNATRAVRRAEADAGGRAVVIALTAAAETDDRERCAAAGMDGCLRKPIEACGLHQLLAELRPEWVERSDRSAATPAPRSAGPIDPLQASFLPLFLKSAALQAAEIRDGAQANDADRIRRAAHALNGSASTLEMTEIASLAETIERAAKTNQLEIVPSTLDDLDSLLGRLRKSQEKEGVAAPTPL